MRYRVLAVTALIAAAVTIGFALPARATTSQILAYSDAVSAGLVPVDQQYDSQHDPATCVPGVNWSCTGPTMYCTNNGSTDGGYSTEADLLTAEAAAPSLPACATDPRTESFASSATDSIDPFLWDSGGGGNPATGHSMTSQNSWGNYRAAGISASVEEGNPYTINTANNARVNSDLAVFPYSYNNGLAACVQLHEIGATQGQAELNYFSDGHPHAFAAANGGYNGNSTATCRANGGPNGAPIPNYSGSYVTYYAYAFQPTNFYGMRIMNVAGYGTQAEVFWAGQWQVLGGAGWEPDFSCGSSSAANCYIYIGLEVVQSTAGDWAYLNAPAGGQGNNFRSVQYEDKSSIWHAWSSGVGASGPIGSGTPPGTGVSGASSSPYNYCGDTNYTAFRVIRGTPPGDC
jgi:hypothetical protein